MMTMRRLVFGVSGLLLVIGGFFGYPYTSWGDQTTLRICIVTNPDEVCDPTNGIGGGGSGSSGGGSGGGGGLFAFDPLAGHVSLRGIAYPGSMVVLMRDGQIISQTQAGEDAVFLFDIDRVTPGAYTYGVWSRDTHGNRSIVYTFTIPVANGVGTVISGIFLPPTISFDKSQVRQGDTIRLFGETAPQARLHVSVGSAKTLVRELVAEQNGSWTYYLDTSLLEYGRHTVTSKAFVGEVKSGTSTMIQFTVGDQTVLKAASVPVTVDLNGDSRVNIVDFSIMAFWYKRPLTETGARSDLNHDNKVDLKDFSILAYYWTG